MSKLKKFNKSNKKRNTIKLIVAFLLVAVMSAVISYAVYQKEDEVLFINARVGQFETSSSDIELAMTLDSNAIDTPPSKGDGYYNVIVECDHADGEWDKEKWGAIIINISSNRVKCNVNFETLETRPLSIVELGDYISMTPTSTSYTLPNDLSGCDGTSSTCIQNEINPSELNLWRVIKKNEDGTVDVISECVSSKSVYFYGKTGYMNFVGGLNTIASQYTNEKYVSKTRHMGYSNQILTLTSTNLIDQQTVPWTKSTVGYQYSNCDTNNYLCGKDEVLGAGDIGQQVDYKLINNTLNTLLGKTPSGEPSTYWLASRQYGYSSVEHWWFAGKIIMEDGSSYEGGLISSYTRDLSYGASVRPILTLKSDVKITSGDGSSADTAYQLQ